MSLSQSHRDMGSRTRGFAFALLLLLVGSAVYFGTTPSDAQSVDVLSDNPGIVPNQSSGITHSLSGSDQFWNDRSGSNLLYGAGQGDQPKNQRILTLNKEDFAMSLGKAPLEFSNGRAVTISLPVPDGRLWQFQIVESPVLSPELSAKYPEIKSYSGQSGDDPTATVRLNWSPRGLTAFVISEQGSFLVAPVSPEDSLYYRSYFTHDLNNPGFECLTGTPRDETPAPVKPDAAVTDGSLRRYRLAVTVTPEFIAAVGGGTDAGTIAAVTNYVNNVRAIYEREIGVSFTLVVWNPAFFGVPLLNGNLQQMDQQNQFFLDNLFFGGFAGSSSYDIGFALGFDPQRPSGLVLSLGAGELGCACQASVKAVGGALVPGPSTSDFWGSIVMAHEIGHMFGGRHTFTPINTSQCVPYEDAAGKVEPGSGSTIMSYAGICGLDNLATGEAHNAANSYFHIHSLLKIRAHKAALSSCGQTVATGNSAPVISNPGTGGTIPALTPFTLTAAATDPNGDALTYSWEEWDPTSTLFRAYVPSSSPSRTFPSPIYILNNGNVPPMFVGGLFSGEALPPVSGTLNFMVTVRDNRSGGGGTAARDDFLRVNIVGTAGPFRVTQPNTGILTSGAQTTITWNVAGTNLAPISTSAVRILLSTDGGSTFPTVLAVSTANDGSEVVTLPSVQTNTARVKIEAIGNIYFDVSDANFTISNSLPNLVPYQPAGWSDKMVVSNATGTNTDSNPLRTTDTLVVDWALVNNGAVAINTAFNEILYVDGVAKQTFITNPPLNAGIATVFQDFSIGSLSAGTHTIKIVADSGGVVAESNESDNEYTKTITVLSPVQPNLTTVQPAGWSDKIVVSTGTGTNIDSNPLRTNNTLFVDWALINNGAAAIGVGFNEVLYVDGLPVQTFGTNPPLNVNSTTTFQDFSIGSLSAGTHTIKIVADSGGVISESNESDNEYTRTITVLPPVTTLQFGAFTYNASESAPSVTATVTRIGDTSAASSVNFTTGDNAGSQNCTLVSAVASSRCDYISALGTLKFAAGETSKTISILIINDSYAEGSEFFNVVLSSPTGGSLGLQSATTIAIADNDSTTGANPINAANFYVTMQYSDFLNRQPDAAGLAFWVSQFTPCGANQGCIDVTRVNVSAAFYLSIEFQETGYLVERIYKSSYADALGVSTFNGTHNLPVPMVRFNEFLADTQEIGAGVVVNQGNWQQQLENNKQAFIVAFVQRARFVTAFPTSLTPAQFVDRLFANAGVSPSVSDRTAAINEFGIALNTSDQAARARSLRRVAENSTLVANESNRAFVLMQYFGYLRRNPNDPQDTDYTGYDFWLTKLDQFHGNYIDAEMIKAFITSIEYRQRFGP